MFSLFVMKKKELSGIIDHTFETPEENLKFEEDLLNYFDDSTQTVNLLRFWESPSYFVVLGSSNKSDSETFFEKCSEKKIPILKRCSGGGTVLQGPGCLNYALIHTIDEKTKDITKTNSFVMESLKKGFNTLGIDVSVKGFTDLTVKDKKFSGNAQKRKRNTFLFHGTILYDFNLTKISEFLKYPSKSPDYRLMRSHHDFVSNILIKKDNIIKCIGESFQINHYLDLNELKFMSNNLLS
ncbi:lipoate--protein ligase family protein [Candidatus Marinamargulisbacteria bacterium SCGC AAA071-K20]|nr:lipoate--protein ligase family protein [Candidatus Marinamargulisbacteria bacterium SCGC AAA071-K20]